MSARRRAGFTLIELLVVIAIVITLVALLGAGLGRARDSAKEKATRALIGKLKIALQNYHSEFRDYPPDGFDVEIPGTDAVGAPVGTPVRKMKNTALLMYFLCRPVIKLTYMGDPNDRDASGKLDPRNIVRTPVGPFLEISASNYSRGRGDGTGDLSRFDPNFVWGGSRGGSFWDAPNDYRLTEIIDAYGRPLCYDKVKTNASKYWQPDRFHRQDDGGGTGVAGKGAGVHPDQDYVKNQMPVLEDRLCDEPTHGPSATSNEANWWTWHPDPRVTPANVEADGCIKQITAGPTTHAPKSIGNYDLWSFGKSYTNPRDDITSWGE